MPTFSAQAQALLEELEASGRATHGSRIAHAFQEAGFLYGSAMHWSGVSLFDHVCEVLRIMLPFQPDEDAIIACLFHHALAADMTLTELEQGYGARVRGIVSSVHLLAHIRMQTSKGSVDDLRLMILTVSDDVRVILTILCDRASILESGRAFPVEQGRALARDGLNLFAPVAARLGIYALKTRIEKAAFILIHPADAERIAEQLETINRRVGVFLPQAAELLQHALATQAIPAEVSWREKASYSIFLKMKAKAFSSVESIHDLFALRIVVGSNEDCYRALGIVHRLGHPVQNRFKDFIAFPKPNGYQSLHTTVSRLPGVPQGIFVEVQLRTSPMHREAELGIAAHWHYKEGGAIEKATRWLQMRSVLAGQQGVRGEGTDPDESIILRDHIYVLTPKGAVIELPEEATPLDFAFAIHTDLGLSFRAAKVNGAIAPLDTSLENGDVVEILRHTEPRPSPEWLKLLKLASARSRLRRFLIKIGQESERASSGPPRLDTLKATKNAIVQSTRAPSGRLQRKDSLIAVEGGIPLPIRFAKCCKPQEVIGSPIVGSIIRTGSVMIHREKCRMVRNANPQRKIGVQWRTDVT